MDSTAKSRKGKSKASCCVPQCNKPGYTVENGQPVTFHKLPVQNQSTLSLWLVKIRRDVGPYFKVTSHTRICSRHFLPTDFKKTAGGKKLLKPNVLPSIFPWTKPQKERSARLRQGETDLLGYGDMANINQEIAKAPPKSSEEQDIDSLKEKVAVLQQQLCAERQKSAVLKQERDLSRKLLQSQQGAKSSRTFCIEIFAQNDSDICFYTGFPTYNALLACFRLLDPVNNILYRDAKGRERILKEKQLSYMNQFFLTLVRLRVGLLLRDLAHRFNISRSSANRYFISWINFMYLKLGSLNIWPTKDYIRSTMPETIKEKFPDLDWIVDAFELQIQRPTSLCLQSQSYSSYKSRNTVKGLIACTPSGQIGFVSQLYTGNLSDRELVKRSGFLNMPHNRGSTWLVDKGFQIADLAEPLGVTVNMPAFVGSRSQMTAKEVFQTQVIASHRIHVERAINKVKRFHFFDRPIPLSALGSANQAWTVCALLTLFQNPIISA